MVEVATSTLEIESDDELVTVRLNRPDSLNAITREMLDGLLDCFEQLTEESERSVLITGAGRATSSGVDLDIIELPREEKPNFRADEHRLFDMIHEYPRPTGVAGKGALVGAAFVFALDADFVVLGEETHFSFPEIQHGIFAGRTTRALAEQVGTRNAKEVVLTGDPIPPERAREMGLVTEVVPEAEVEERAAALLRQVGGYDPDAVRQTKEQLTYDFEDPDL